MEILTKHEWVLTDVDVAHNDVDADISLCLTKPYDPGALLFVPPLVHKHLNSQMHAHTQTQLSHKYKYTHTDLISTWKQTLQHPRGELCAKLSWWLHLVYISLELDHDLQQGCCLPQLCGLAYLQLIRRIFQNNASNCVHKALQGDWGAVQICTHPTLRNYENKQLFWTIYAFLIWQYKCLHNKTSELQEASERGGETNSKCLFTQPQVHSDA